MIVKRNGPVDLSYQMGHVVFRRIICENDRQQAIVPGNLSV
ncbi:MAG: hypothetical protein PVF73_03975 [Bacteroidales bacterium]